MDWKFGDRVEIGGRTMLRPGFSLVGLAGMVFVTAPGAPSGCVTVKVDWLAFDYTEENGYPADSLPPVVNVPSEHLILLEANPTEFGVQNPILKPDPNAPPKPTLGVVHGGAEPHFKDEPAANEPDEDDEPPRPKLRLV